MRSTTLVCIAVFFAACTPVSPSGRPPISPSMSTSHSESGEPTPATPTPSAETPEALSEVFGVSSEEAWAVTQRRVLRTTDGGASWSTVLDATASALTLGQLSVVDGTTWLVESDPERRVALLRSTDGGRAWQTVLTVDGIGASLTSWNARYLWLGVSEGFATGSQGFAIYSSTTPGVDWQKVAETNPEVPAALQFGCHKGPLSFSGPNVGWLGLGCAGGSPALLRTADGGRTWDRMVVMPAPGESDFATEGILFDNRSGVAVVNAGHQYLLTTADGGQSWSPKANVKATGEPAILSPTTWYVRDQGELKLTRNAGATWADVGTAPPGEIHFLSESVAWAVMSPMSLEVGRTLDGGSRWERHQLPAGVPRA